MKFSYSFVQGVSLLLSLSPSAEGFTRSRNDACKPNHPFHPLPPSQPRTKTCHVVSNGRGRDDSKNIMQALHKCNNGGKVVFDADKVYTVGTALDMTFLKHIDLGKNPYC
jgi:galacturan 1,4-alpha-galacturonidase